MLKSLGNPQNFSHIFQLARWISKPTLDRLQIFSNNTLGEIENLESYFSSSPENLHSPRWSISSFCIIFNDWGGLRKSMKWAKSVCKKIQNQFSKKGKCWRYFTLCTKTEIILDPYWVDDHLRRVQQIQLFPFQWSGCLARASAC